jgi:hypothetical protein
MTSAAELRAEAQRIREFALTITDEEVLAEIQEMILELERRARALGNGNATGSIERDMPRMTYRAIPQTGERYSVEMVSLTGKRSLVEDFRDQAEADAWFVQTVRMLHDPRDKEPTRKSGER